MANEISVSASMRAQKTSINLDTGVLNTTKTFDMSGDHYHASVQDVGTTYEALSINADLATAGYTYLRNLDATNYVEVGLEVGAAFQTVIKLKAGRFAVLPFATKSLFGRANTAAVKLQIVMLED